VALALLLALLRALDALSLRTYFNPDEHWQGPEVAHKLVFGVGLL
jgi:phosphatidylinositol glycan class B